MAETQSSRDKILDVAEALFARRGFAGVGLREVAEASGLGEVVAYSTTSAARRSSTSRCWRACCGRSTSASTPALAASRLAARAARALDRRADRRARRAPDHARLLLRGLFEDEDCGDSPEARRHRGRCSPRSSARASASLREGIERGDFRPVSAAPHAADADRRHRLPLRVGRGRRGHPRPAAVLRRGRAPPQAEVIALLRHGCSRAP